ncbi:MAG: tyrosine-protein phosphatase YwqE [Marinoscillum sp.]|jgi:tyrosine-protein phosphatase YwqE
MIGWFFRKKQIDVKVDIHSHLLPGIDDGVKSFEEALKIILHLKKLGYEKLITTPHIYQDYYPNTPVIIREKLDALKVELKNSAIEIEVEAAAEYFVDGTFIDLVKNGDEVLCFGKDNYVLIETGFQHKPIILDEAIFELKTRSFTPILAHPERYEYIDAKLTLLHELREKGVKLQVSLPSLKGYYGPEPKRIATKLLKKQMVDFLGSDLHRESQLEGLGNALKTKILDNPILNNELMDNN